jgi:hypothetical protein
MDVKGTEIHFLVGANSFLFATIFRPVLGLAQIPTQWAPRLFTWKKTAISSLYLLSSRQDKIQGVQLKSGPLTKP